MNIALVSDASTAPELYPNIECANAPFTAAAATTPSGYLVASAAGRAWGECGLDNGIPGPAKDLHVFLVRTDPPSFEIGTVIEGNDPLSHVALPTGNGRRWVVWQENGQSAEQPPPIQAALLNQLGALDGTPFPLPTTEGQLGPFAAAAFGPWLAVAWVDALDPSTPTLRVDLFDDAGQWKAGSSVSTAPSWLFDPSLSLLASPDGTQLVLAWADEAPPEPATVRVARFGCVEGI
jgi:hypothetical protein